MPESRRYDARGIGEEGVAGVEAVIAACAVVIAECDVDRDAREGLVKLAYDVADGFLDEVFDIRPEWREGTAIEYRQEKAVSDQVAADQHKFCVGLPRAHGAQAGTK